MSAHTPGPLAWQKFGTEWCLTGQYGMRPIVLSVSRKGALQLRDAKRDLLIPFDPKHPDARLIAAAPLLYKELTRLVSLMEPIEQQGGGLRIPGLATLNGARLAISAAEGGQP